MTTSVTTQDLSTFTPLSALNPEHLQEVARKARPVRLKAGKRLFSEGDEVAAQWYLREGVVEVLAGDGTKSRVEAGSPAAASALEGGNPARRTAIARSDVLVYTIDRSLLDMMLTWDQTGSYHVAELSGDEVSVGANADEEDWMVRLLRTEAFHRIPPANIQAIFMRMEPVGFSAGEEIIRQGDPGDYFYIVRDGRCSVTRTTKGRPDGIRLAELGPGDGFGEEALISDSPRNATVTMVTDGTVMRLAKADFQPLLSEPLQRWIDYSEASEHVRAGARWLDVRVPGEFESRHIRGASNLPLFILRMKAAQLEDVEYIVYCDTGSRSSAAAYLLSERGFSVRVLRNGMADVPDDALE